MSGVSDGLLTPRSDFRRYAGAAATVGVAGIAAFLIRAFFPVESLSLIFLVAVLLVARWWGRWPSIFASLLSFLVYDFFFTEPYLRFEIADKGLVLTLVLFLVVATLMGDLSARLSARIEAERAAAAQQSRLTAKMEEARVVAERERLRSALLSSVSHDLRTPLVSIIGAATSLLDAPDGIDAEGKRALVETIRDEGERLNRYVQNLLDMTRISGGALVLKREWIDVRELVGGALRQVRHQVEGRTVSIETPEGLPPANGDALLLEQALVNILDNACKYAADGSAIVVSAAVSEGMLRISVSDAGPGIPVGDRERVFDMFHRVKAGDRQNTGTGLGLAIARGILRAHGGDVVALPNAASGRGTRMELSMPAMAGGTMALADAESLAEPS